MATSVDGKSSSLMSLLKCVCSIRIELQDPIFQANPTLSNLINQLHNLLQPLASYLIHNNKIATNSGRASTHGTIAISRQIERQAIAEATPVTYISRDLLLLIHEHLLASGLFQTASMLLEEAQLKPLPSLVAPSSLVQQPSSQEATPVQLQWPSGRAPGFLSKKLNLNAEDKDVILPKKHKLSDLKDTGVSSSPGKKLNATALYTPSSSLRNQLPNNPERITLDSIVVQYLKHQHCQCPTPITTLPPLSLLHPHVCTEPKQSLDATSNVTSRLGTREFKLMHNVHGSRRDRKFVYSQFGRSDTSADNFTFTGITFLGNSHVVAVGNDHGDIVLWDLEHKSAYICEDECHRESLTLIQSFVSVERQLLLSSSSEDVKLWNVSSFLNDHVWDQYENVIHLFYGCKAARFSHSGNVFAALPMEFATREVMLYDIQSCKLESTLLDTCTAFAGRDYLYSPIHFSPSDSMLLWNGALWDRRVSEPVHHFDQLTDFGGGGFHPAGNEVIINSEVWDLRKLRLLRIVPSLDQTTITFNAHGDVIYAILRRNIEDVKSVFHTRWVRHPLYAAFRTLDAVNYSDIATTPVEHCVLDFTSEPTDMYVGLVTIGKNEYRVPRDDLPQTWGCVKIYEIGHRSPTDDD